MNNYEKLILVLKEIFQLDQADLDFGIYRIMNQKREEIDHFLQAQLLPQVKTLIAEANLGDATAIKKELEKAVAGANVLGMNPDDVPKVQELKAQLETTQPVERIEEEVFSHLAAFFKRYYDKGDFISLRRYKKDVYAIPYEGEEVKLYWANHDQYYIKSSEYLKNYQFKVGERNVKFELVEANTEQNNNKAQNGKERQFRIAEAKPLEVKGDTLVIYFTYLPSDKKAKREDLNTAAFEAVKAQLPSEWVADVLQAVPTTKKQDRTLLEKHINDFTARNTFDYFIHKDLGGFLRRELDFYIKNEVLHIDDINTEDTKDFSRQLTKIKALKVIAQKVIVFLEQIENFQKRLWLKKKFVVETNYCITLDKIPESYYEQIANNEAQWEEWERLFTISELPKDLFNGGAAADRMTILKQQPYLLLDTCFFDEDFKSRLLGEFENLEEETDGLLINSENFQALQLLQNTFNKSADFIYLDPPYNTRKDSFIYKDGYKSSSWLSMMKDRLDDGRFLLKDGGVLFSSIDSYEVEKLQMLLDEIYGLDNNIGTIIWHNARDNNPTRVAVEHEYILTYTTNQSECPSVWKNTYSDGKQLLETEYKRLKDLGATATAIQRELRKFIKDNKEALGEVERYKWVDEGGIYTGSESVHNPHPNGYDYEIIHPITNKPMRKPANGYRFPYSTIKQDYIDTDRLIYGEDEKRIVKIKLYLKDYKDSLRSVIKLDGRLGAYALNALFGKKKNLFNNPKAVQLLERLFAFGSNKESILIDYFAGSGTTIHAAINIGRSSNTKQRYVGVEMGEYFNTVTKPRIQKVIYSEDWKDGKPVSRKGSSHIFKYIRLESYEDTLNNLRAIRSQAQADALDFGTDFYEEYMLGYMLNTETKESLLSINDFKQPFNYQLEITENNEPKPTLVDMVETFNYLIGLKVATTKMIDGFRVITGTKRTGEPTLVIWRTIENLEQDNAKLQSFFEQYMAERKGFEAQHIYVNGDNTIANIRKDGDTWRVYLTERVFLQKMFDTTNV